MTTTKNNLNTPGDAHADRDVLLSRIIDGRADAGEWAVFRQLATSDASIWDDLRAMQHDHDALVHAVDEILLRSDDIGLPDPARTPTPGRIGGVSSWGPWLGWGAAACIALAWFGLGGPTASTSNPESNSNTQSAALLGDGLLRTGNMGDRQNEQMGDMVQISHPQQALDTYMSRGRDAGLVLGELNDRPMLRTAQLPDGQLEVLWVRQIVERSVLPATFRASTDEFGNPVAMPVQLEQIADPNGPVH